MKEIVNNGYEDIMVYSKGEYLGCISVSESQIDRKLSMQILGISNNIDVTKVSYILYFNSLDYAILIPTDMAENIKETTNK